MFVLGGALLGLIVGAMIARKRKGKRLDVLQYAAVYALIFAIIGLFFTIGIHRFAV